MYKRGTDGRSQIGEPRLAGSPVVQRRPVSPPLASQIHAGFNQPNYIVVPHRAGSANLAPKAAQNVPSPNGSVQRKQGPPPLASEILSKLRGQKVVLQRKEGPPNPVSKSEQVVVGSNSTVQRKHGPPPLAGEILARLRGTQGGSVQPKTSSNYISSQAPTVNRSTPNALHLAQRYAARPLVFPGRNLQSSTVQPFQIKKGNSSKNYNSKDQIGDYAKNKQTGTWEGTKLVKEVLEDATFAAQGKEVAYWLHQYASTYQDDTFTMDELKVYLYDDIIREKRVIPTKKNPSPDMKTQELLTTTAGLKRIQQGTQAFPENDEVRFYRGVDLAELKKLLGDATMSNEELPYTGEVITKQVKANAASLGAHLGDYKQAKTYYDQRGGALLEFVIKTDLFKPENIALTQSNTTEIAKALKAKYTDGYQSASANEGTHSDLPGLKSESRGPYSIGLSSTGKTAIMTHVKRVKVIHINRVG